MNTVPICFTDLETGGVDETAHPIIEIGAIRIEYPQGYFLTPKEDRKPPERKTLCLKVWPGSSVDPDAAAVNGFSKDTWEAKGALVLEDALRRYYPLLKGARLGGWNIDFDRGFLKRDFRKFNWGWPWGTGHRMLDVQALVWPFTEANFEQPFRTNLEMIVQKLGVLGEDEKVEHSALSDIELTIKVYEFWMDRLADTVRPPEGLKKD